MPRTETVAPSDNSIAGRQVEPLTDLERRILDFMVQYLRANTYQPSIREIGERFGIKSTKTVSEHLQALADKGFLERDPSRSRGVKILGVDLGADSVSLPCFTHVPSSSPQHERPDTYVSIDRRLGGEDGSFFLRAQPGDLAALGVNDGDFVLITPATLDEVANGSIVVAQIGSGSIFHRFIRNGNAAYLESLCPGIPSTVVEEQVGLRLIGRVTGLYRRLDDAPALNLTQH